jgi:hypothetical protein
MARKKEVPKKGVPKSAIKERAKFWVLIETRNIHEWTDKFCDPPEVEKDFAVYLGGEPVVDASTSCEVQKHFVRQADIGLWAPKKKGGKKK